MKFPLILIRRRHLAILYANNVRLCFELENAKRAAEQFEELYRSSVDSLNELRGTRDVTDAAR